METGKSLTPSLTASLCECLLINGENDKKVQVLSSTFKYEYNSTQQALKVICNHFLVVKVNCWSHALI